ncbi:MAG: hypothetical protein V1755_13735 [Chloroflexota bacterium]
MKRVTIEVRTVDARGDGRYWRLGTASPTRASEFAHEINAYITAEQGAYHPRLIFVDGNAVDLERVYDAVNEAIPCPSA